MQKVKLIVGLLVVCVLVVVSTNIWVVASTQANVYSTPVDAPVRSTALVLGTSWKTSGKPNPYFVDRIETAYQLYRNNKVKYILVSGDNRSKYYNEPAEMRKALIAKGIPSQVITLDFAGLRTLDSIVRCKEVFGQDSITIITQGFHSYRSLFISQYYGMHAIAVSASDSGSAFRIVVREMLARTLAVLDLYIFNTAPRHLGQKELLNK